MTTTMTMKKELIASINEAIKASTLEPGFTTYVSWRDLTRKSFQMANDMDGDEFEAVSDLLYEIANLRGSGNALTMNANALLRCAKRMLL